MDYTKDETEEIISNIDSKLDTMSAVAEGLEARKVELEEHLESLVEKEAKLAELRSKLDELENLDADDLVENYTPEEWRDEYDDVQSQIEELEEELGE